MSKADIKVRNKELNCAVREAMRQGIRIERTNNSHLVVIPADKALPKFYLASTPSDYRSVKNGIAKLKRAGYRP